MGKSKVGIPKGQLRYFYEKKRFSIGELAKFFTCGKTTIQRSLHKYGVHVRPSMSVKIRIPEDRLNCLYVDDGKSSVQIAKMYSCTPGTILNRLKEYDIKIRDFSASHIRYPKYDFSEDLIEKSYLIGFRLGDLHVRKYEKNGKILSVECASTHLEQINLIRGLFIKYGYVRITKSDKTDIIRIQCALNPSFNFLLPKRDVIEPWILKNDVLFFAFLAGYLDAEGDIGIYSKNSASLRVGTYDKNILQQVHCKLRDKGIESTFNLDRPKGSKVNLPRGYKSSKEYKTRSDFWRVAVYKKKSLLKLLDQIEPYLKHSRLKIGLLKVRKNIHWRNQAFGNLRMN